MVTSTTAGRGRATSRTAETTLDDAQDRAPEPEPERLSLPRMVSPAEDDRVRASA